MYHILYTISTIVCHIFFRAPKSEKNVFAVVNLWADAQNDVHGEKFQATSASLHG